MFFVPKNLENTECRVNRLSRNIYNDVIGDITRRRAIAFAIYMKNARPASVVKDWSIRKLARITHLAQGTCKEYVKCLREMKLVYDYSKGGHSYLVFKPLKESKKKNRWGSGYHTPKHKDVMLGNYDRTSIQAIERHLKALVICETQRRKNYAEQSIGTKQNPKNLRDYKKADKVCRARGWNSSYVDNGISYKSISAKLGCSPNTVSETIQYGEKANLFKVTRYDPEIVFFGVGQAREAAEYLDIEWTWCTDDVIVRQHANTYTLCDSK